MEILKQLEAKNKVMNTIESCETLPHFIAVKRFINLYKNKFGDMVGYYELDRMFMDGVSNVPFEKRYCSNCY